MTFFGENSTELKVKNSAEKFVFIIPNKVSSLGFDTVEKNASITENYLVTKPFVISKSDLSINIQIKAGNNKIGYLFAIRVNAIPVLNSTHKEFNFFRLFCPSGLF